MRKSAVERVKEAVAAFEAVQKELSEFGAEDTEPDYVFQSIVWRAMNLKPYKIPTSGEAWDLYTCSMKCGRAGQRLASATKKVVSTIESTPIGEAGPVREYVQDYCWRVS